MNYEEASEYMSNLSKRGIHPGLEGVKMLCDSAGNPEKKLKYIHVVGTNGKGSTSLFISEILREMGLKVGLYTSPAVFCDREIVKVNGRNITKQEYADIVEYLSKLNTMGCTRFELETVMAFLYFCKKECDVVILEAGMGGELDATNIIEESMVSVFTSIGMDHTQYLGDTVEEIARTKAGVIKYHSIAVSTLQSDSCINVIREVSESRKSDFVISDYREAVKVKYKLNQTVFTYKDFKDLAINLRGTYQVRNACLAIDTVLMLNRYGVCVSEKHIRRGLLKAREEGRFEIISEKPLVIIDGAHNEPASLALRETLQTYFTKKRFIYIMGMLRDKDCSKVIENTVDLADCIFTVATPNKARTLSSFELASLVKEHNQMVSSLDSIEEAVEMAYMMADKDTVIVCFGSLSHLSEIKKVVSRR